MEILYQDSGIVVCRKEAGMDSETDVPQALQAQLGVSVLPVHRLDRGTAGLMVYACTKPAAAALSRAIAQGQFHKEYLALVHGCPPEKDVWENLLFKDSRKNKVFVVKRPRAGVRAAKLSYQVLRPGAESLVRVFLETGRSHQIRVQFSSRGYPLVGDHKYGSRSKLTEPRLFSAALCFPWNGKALRFEASPEWAE